MNYILMHKNVQIAELHISEQTGYISKIGQVYDYRHLPVGIGYKKGVIDRAALGEWWKDRAIPTSRSGVEKALKQLNITDSTMLLTKCFVKARILSTSILAHLITHRTVSLKRGGKSLTTNDA